MKLLNVASWMLAGMLYFFPVLQSEAANPGFHSAYQVEVSSFSDQTAQDIGITESRIQNRIELALRKNGIPISTGTFNSVTLACSVHVFYPTVGGVAGNVSLNASQAVQPGISDLWMNASIWNGGGYFAVCKTDGELRADIIEAIDVLLDKFCNEWLESKSTKYDPIELDPNSTNWWDRAAIIQAEKDK